MDNPNFNTQSLNLLFSLFNTLSSAVFWIRDASYQKQIFVSQGYENVWGRSCESLYEHPQGWAETLVSDDSYGKLLTFEARKEQIYQGMVLFRIVTVDGKVNYIKDYSCPLLDKNNQLVAVLGVGECISETEWQSLLNQPDMPACNIAGAQDFFQIIQAEYRLNVCNHAEPLQKAEKNFGTARFIHIDQAKVKITKREDEVLQYLLKGYSAKQTAWLLELSTRTVETYLENLRKKVGVRSKTALMSKIISTIES